MEKLKWNISSEEGEKLWDDYYHKVRIKSPKQLLDASVILIVFLMMWMVSLYSTFVLKWIALVSLLTFLYMGITYFSWTKAQNRKTRKLWKPIFIVCRIGQVGLTLFTISIGFLASAVYISQIKATGDTPVIFGIVVYMISALAGIIVSPIIFFNKNLDPHSLPRGKRYLVLEKLLMGLVGTGVLLGTIMRNKVGGGIVIAGITYLGAVIILEIAIYFLYQAVFLATKTKMS